jgi:hypothetical protein
MMDRKDFLKLLGLGTIGLLGISCGFARYVTEEQAQEMAHAAADSAVKTVLAANPTATPLITLEPTATPTVTPTSTFTPSPTPTASPTETYEPAQVYYWWYYYPPSHPTPKPNKQDECPPGNHCKLYWERINQTPTPSPTPRHPHHHP